MADTEELRRLVLHAVDLLEGVKPTLNAEQVNASDHREGVRCAAIRRATEEVAAIAYAKGVLSMVAACMAVEASAKEAPDGDV